MMTTAEFLETVEAFLAKTKIPPSRFGKEVVGDPNFVFDLRNGRKPNLEVANKVLTFIECDRPFASGDEHSERAAS